MISTFCSVQRRVRRIGKSSGGSPNLATSFSDEQLCRIARGGSQLSEIASPLSADEAFEELYDRHFPRISKLASIMLSKVSGCEQDGEFVANGAMAKVYRAIRKEQFDDTRSFLPWLNQITRNAVRDLVCKQAADPTIQCSSGRAIAIAQDTSFSVITTETATENAEEVRLALGVLPEEERSVMELHYLQGFSIKQIGLQLGKSNGAVRGLIQRAKIRLRTSLSFIGIDSE